MSTSLFAYLNGSDVAQKVRLNGFGLSSRADGSVAMGGIEFDDPNGSLTVRGWMTLIVKELACTAAPVLFTGFIADRNYQRTGQQATYKTGAGRFIDTTCADQNAVLHIRLITGDDGNRPAETDIERIDWLLASGYLSGLISDTSLVSTDDPRPFQEADYRGQYPDDVLNDIAGPINRLFFVYPVQPTGARGLWFDRTAATVGTSTITISNVLSDASATCFYPLVDAVLNRDPSQVYAKIRYHYKNGTIIFNNPDTRNEFFLDNGLGYRGLQVDNSRIGTEASARHFAEKVQGRDSTEADTITVTIQLPPASAGLIDAGQRIGVRFTHLPGYETLTYTRVTERTIRQTEGTDQLYDVILTCSTHGLSSNGGGGAPGTGDFPNPPPQAPLHYYSGTLQFLSDSYGSGGGAAIVTPGPNATTSTTNTDYPLFEAGTTYNYSITIVMQGGDGPPAVGLADNGGLWMTPHVGGFGTGTQTFTGSFDPAAFGSGGSYHGYLTANAGAAGHVPKATVVTWTIDPVGWDPGDGPVVPEPAQWVLDEAVTDGDGTTVTFTTQFPYASGSLRVRVDGVPIIQGLTETDPATGSFTLDFAPLGASGDTPAEKVVADYQGI